MDQQQSDSRPVVLLVEDEPLVRMLGMDVLEEAGFEVVEAANADEALSHLQARPDVQVLFTDIDMPGKLDGLDLARAVHKHWPEIGLLIASGKVRPSAEEIPDSGRFLPKPYELGAVVRIVRELAAPN
jgi:CheY-like chemotaxis protein